MHWQSCLYIWKTLLSSLDKPAPLDSHQHSHLCGLLAEHAVLWLWNLANVPIPGKGLNTFHFRYLQSILSGCWCDYVPNATILERTGVPDMFSLLRIYQLCWSGHVCRMEDGRLPKHILYRQLPPASQPVSHPKLHYKEVSKTDLKPLNINRKNQEQLTPEYASWHSLLQNRRACSVQTYITDCNCDWTDRRTQQERP